MVRINPPHVRRLALAVAVVLAGAIMAGSGPSNADVSAVRGEAFGASADFTIFATRTLRQPSPLVQLPPGGSATPIMATEASSVIFGGPMNEAVLFSSGPLNVSTVGTPGPTGSVTSTASIDGVNQSDSEVVTATNVTSTCSASEAGGVTGSTTITGGRFQVDSGEDFNPPFNDIPNHPPEIIDIPSMPPPNFTLTGHVHIGPSGAQDNYTYVFNEQTILPDGSLRVRAFHAFLEGPTAVGELIVGEVICGVTIVEPTTTSTTTTSTTSTTLAPTTTSTSTSTTLLPTTTSTSTSTTLLPTTTSTTTSTTLLPTTTSTTIFPTSCRAILEDTRARVNQQIDAARASILLSVPAEQQAVFLASLETIRASANAQIDAAIASCPN